MDIDQDIRVELGGRLRHLRKEQGLTQTKLAERIGLNDKYYSEIERGLRNITLVNIKRIAEGLDVTLGELFRFPEEKPLNAEGEEIVTIITRLLQKGSKKKMRQVLVILKEIC